MRRTDELCADLRDEHAALDEVVSDLSAEQWSASTPAAGWTVCDQISHLAYFDAAAALALVSPERFEELTQEMLSGSGQGRADVALGRSVAPDRLLADWRRGRIDLLEAAQAADETRRVPWYGPDMSLASFVTARLMETWAHGQDVRDALGLPPSVSARLRHLCHLGYAARRYAFLVHERADPGTPVRMDARAPDGTSWSWGPPDASETLTGSALGLALVFTQRRHPSDTDVVASGETAEAWLGVAQAFAGPPGTGRAPGLAVRPDPARQSDDDERAAR